MPKYLIFILILLLSCKSNYQADKEKQKIESNDQRSDSILPIRSITIDTTIFNLEKLTDKLKPISVRLGNGDSFQLKLLPSYNLSIAAEGMKRLRFLTKSPDNRLFATDMYDRSDNFSGRIWLFENWNASAQKFDTKRVFADRLHNPNQIAFYKNYLYIAETDKLIRYLYTPGDTTINTKPEVIIQFPDYGLGYKYGGWHLTRSIAVKHDKIYVSVGSSCNACIEKEDIRASIIEINPDGTDFKIFATGLRNSVGLKWIGNQLFGTGMGRDLIGPDKPEDVFQKIDRGVFYGWPYYFQYKNAVYEDDQFKDSIKPENLMKPPLAFTGFKAHSAPLGFEHFKNFADPDLNNSVLVCLHGSTSVWRARGNEVVKLEKGNTYSAILSGFLSGKTEADRHGRPCDILMNDTRSFFITDDLKGVLYYLWK